MKNKITIIVLSLMMLIFTSTSFACNFQISQFGDPKEKIVIDPVPLAFPDQFGGKSLAEGTSYKTGEASMATYYTIFSCGKGKNNTIVPLEAIVTLTK